MEQIQVAPIAQKELKSVTQLDEMVAERQATIDSNNWNYTVDSIERNAKEGRKVAWSEVFLNDEQVRQFQEKGYRVYKSEGNFCHKIEW